MQDWTLDRWLAVLGAFGTALGILLSIWIWARSRQEAVPRFRTQTLELIAPRNEKYYFSSTDIAMRVQHDSESSDRVSKVFVAVWNSGRKTLDAADSVGEHQYRVIFPPGVMVWGNPRIIQSSRSEISMRTGVMVGSRSDIFIDFDFLDKDDGGLVEILCAGGPLEVTLEGPFKGAASLRGKGNLGLTVSVSLRERLLAILPQFITGGPAAWFLWVQGLLLTALLISAFRSESILGTLTYLLMTIVVSVFVILAGAASGGPDPLAGSTSGVPKKIRTVPYVASTPRSGADSEVRRFLEDLQLEIARRRRVELHPWERGEPGVFGKAVGRWMRRLMRRAR